MSKILITENSKVFERIKYLYQKFPDMFNLYIFDSNYVFSSNAVAELYNINSFRENTIEAFDEYICDYSLVHSPIDKKYKKFAEAMKKQLIPDDDLENYVIRYVCACFVIFYNFLDKDKIIKVIEKYIMASINNPKIENISEESLNDLLQFEEYREKVKSWIMLLKLNGGQ